ncbi:HsdM family class I SAM-dependent methyltransferase [Methylobacterium tardum]|uniref:HsdM family class I SAM-dependent methyltransferase n=1 Tax=Methylobacterium tardum TaxID=374432 RepID=UPI001EDD3FFA|nr:N-6 DNA methylase [Methylobacterium tardum]URD38196.1 N-6 DNA methylase [Methylobacterium tardum]
MRDDALSQRLNEICEQLGYTESETFVTADTLGADGQRSYVVREAIRTIGIAAVFGLAGSLEASAARPVVYLAAAADADQVRRIRREVWTQGVVPFLIIVSPGTLTICSGFEPPSEKAVVLKDDGPLPKPLLDLSAARLRSSIAWQNFDVALKSSVDNRLVDAIEALNRAARNLNPSLKDERNLVNAAIGRFLYLYVLIDRGILHEAWLREVGTNREGAALFASAVCADGKQGAWTAQDAFEALDAVDGEINGSVFPITEDQRALLTDEVCRLIHTVLRAGTTVEAIGGQQLDFFDVSYRVLRTETISAIYERFVAIEDGNDKADDGVFYTPPHLADHVLDLMEEAAPLTVTSRIIDPAAGSGVFLVGAFRRIMERATPEGGWSQEHIYRAHDLLTRCIFGAEKQAQATNVCRFSLYLTLLDYVGNAQIENLVAAAGDVKFLPDLTKNILCTNAFDLTPDLLAVDRKRYTHVIGNPPWSQKGGQKDRANVRINQREEAATAHFSEGLDTDEEPVAQGRMSDLFVWLAKKHLAEHDGVIALVLPTRSLVGLKSGRFAHAVARAMTPVFIGNLSHLRRKLFDGAQAPAMIAVLRNRPPERTDRVAIYRPLLTSLPLGKKRDIWALFLAQADMQYVRAEDLQSGPSGWYEQTMLRALDRRMRGALVTWTRARSRTFGDFLTRSRLAMTRGASPTNSGVSRRPNGADKDVKLMPITPYALEQANPDYRARFSGNVILVPRSMAEAFYLRDPHAYSSSFNAILPEAQQRAGRYDPETDVGLTLRDKVVNALIQYLNAPILRYFAALYGSGQLADSARFEREELLSVPCPYSSVDDPVFLALAARSDVDDAILDAMNAGDEFRRAYRDFRDFRRQFGNARIPKTSYMTAKTSEVEDYLERVKAEVASALPRGTPMQIKSSKTPGHDAPDAIHILLDGGDPIPRTPPKSLFLGTSVIETYLDDEQIVIWKSTGRHAWTIEQAVADAQVVIRRISAVPVELR